MLRNGDILENPVTGERLVFVATAAETGGECTVIDVFVPPGEPVAGLHVHPYQTELYEIRSGTMGVKLGRRRSEGAAGDVIAVTPGMPHQAWNAGDDELHFRVTVTPSLEFESLLETMFALALAGKTNRKGMPNPLRLAVIAHAHFDVVRLPRIPSALQRLVVAAGASLGRVLGYAPTYGPAAAEPVAAL